MAYREVSVFDVKEVVRLWLRGMAKKAIARQVALDAETVRSYVRAAEASGLAPGDDESRLDDTVMADVLGRVTAPRGRPRGEGWKLCASERDFIGGLLGDGVQLTKVRKLLRRQRRVTVSYGVLRRFAMAKLGWSEPQRSIPVLDGAAGEELQVDTGWMIPLAPDESGRRRRFRAWIFTPVVSRYRFVYPVEKETTASAIEACEAAWEFYGGIFRVLVPDNTKAIVVTPDPLKPVLADAFREYSQARGFVIDPARVRSPRDKARVENAVRTVRADCFGGEKLVDVDAARQHARWWCEADYGATKHRATQRVPREHFDTVEKAALLPMPAAPYDVPKWCKVRVTHEQIALIAKGVYSLPSSVVGEHVTVRVDTHSVKFYDGRRQLVKVHPRVAGGERSIDASDYPAEKAIYAFRNAPALIERAREHGQHVGTFAAALLDAPEPWMRMRRAYALLRLVKQYGSARVDEACCMAVAADMVDVQRLTLMLEAAAPSDLAATRQAVGAARYLRPPSHFAIVARKKDGDR